jgi:thioester reductase-like protein
MAFRPHLKDLRDLIQLSLDIENKPAQLLYCSSMGVALSTIGQSRVAEAPMMDFRQGISTGYTQSKLVAEYIIQQAVEDLGASACILRIGQIVGDTKAGIWNDDEAPPTMIHSALALGCLPALDMVSRDSQLAAHLLIYPPQTCSWIPVDSLADAIVEIGVSASRPPTHLVYNLCNPSTFSWDKDLLPALADAGLAFQTVPFAEWMDRLRQFDRSHSTEEVLAKCPAVKLIDFWGRSYGGKTQRHNLLRYETANAQEDSASMRAVPRIIESGLVKRMLSAWMTRWVPKAGPAPG